MGRSGLWAALAATLPALLWAGEAQAQYRDGTPEVITPPAPAPDGRGAALAEMRAAYERAGAPRMVLFWNRELSDRIANDYDEVVTERGEGVAGAVSGVSRDGRYAAGAKAGEYAIETRRGRREVTDDRRGALFDEDEEWRFLDAFGAELRAQGVRMVDREVAMRGVAAADDAPGDKQVVEMRGIAKHADWLLTVLQTPAPDTPLGVLFRVTVTDLASGQVVHSIVSDGRGPPRGPGRFVAGADGFERQRAPSLGVTAAGANVAMDLMMRMAQARY